MASAYDKHKNFALSTVATAPVPAVSGTSLQVAAGEGALFPTPPFNAVVFPANAAPLTNDAEIVRVTNKVGETFTIVRAQEGSVARLIQVGDRIMDAITAKVITDVEAYAGVSVLTAQPILETGIAGQIRAGRVLTLADFTTLLGLAAPVGLYNLTDVSDASGNGRVLTNKGAVPFGSGIMGATTEAAIFAGSAGQALYIPDAGAADPFRISYGSVSGWFRTAKTGVSQYMVSKGNTSGTSNTFTFGVHVTSANVVEGFGFINGASLTTTGVSNVCDDRWHHFLWTWDGGTMTLIVDGVIESQIAGSGPFAPVAPAQPFNIGGVGADGSTAALQPFFGRMDEVFVTPDVLNLDQARALYAAKVPHNQVLYVPTQAKVAVRRQKKGGPLPLSAFSVPASVAHLYNFTAGSLNDQGALALALTNNNAALPCVGMDGKRGDAYNFVAASSQSLSASDAGLPAGVADVTVGCWIRTVAAAAQNPISYGTGGSAERSILLDAAGILYAADGVNNPGSTAKFNDGMPHFCVAVFSNVAADGLKIKLYADGKLVAESTALAAATLVGANGFRIGCRAGAAQFFGGEVDAGFVTTYAMGADEVANLYAVGSQVMVPSPKNPGAHVEGLDATYAYLIANTLDSQHLLDLEVAA